MNAFSMKFVSAKKKARPVTFSVTMIGLLSTPSHTLVAPTGNAALKAPVVFDGRNLYEPSSMKDFGFEYYPIGRAQANGK